MTDHEDFSRVVANITHELKTPLHSILAVASLLASETDGPLNDEQRRQVEIIARNGEQLLELITELLQFSSAVTATRPLNIRRIDLKRFFQDLVRGLEPLAERSGVQFEADFARLNDGFCTDKALLQRIVGNLLANAFKFSPDGGTVSLSAEITKNNALNICIADSGIGMPPDVLASIFGHFYQADSGDARRFGGVGLGLALVKRAVDLLGGTIEVKSEQGQGSIFTISIPAADDKLQERSILVRDDDPTVCLTLEECFRSQGGYKVYFSQSGEELLAQIGELRPDLVLLDVKAPDYAGFTLLEKIRNSAWGKELPVVLISTLDGPTERSRGFELGASDFIVKPFEVSELIARVRTQTERTW